VFGITDPYFFKDEIGNAITVTSDRYVHMVNEFLFTDLRCRGITLPPSGSNQLEQQHIPLGSRPTP
jgi:hypothetical protein